MVKVNLSSIMHSKQARLAIPDFSMIRIRLSMESPGGPVWGPSRDTMGDLILKTPPTGVFFCVRYIFM